MSAGLSREGFAELEATLMLRGAGRHKLVSPAATQAHWEAKQARFKNNERQGLSRDYIHGQGFTFGIPDYKIVGYETGRFSCSKPNIAYGESAAFALQQKAASEWLCEVEMLVKEYGGTLLHDEIILNLPPSKLPEFLDRMTTLRTMRVKGQHAKD